jgi:hypothetical protein
MTAKVVSSERDLPACVCAMIASAAVALSMLTAPVRAQDAKVVKLLTPAHTEEILSGMKVEFKKAPSPREGTHYYDMRRENVAVRLYLYDNKDIMLDAVFRAQSLEKVNEWNIRAKFSRACLHKDNKGDFVTLESNLDVLGGVTDETIRQFIRTFDAEIKAFVQFTGGPTPAPAGDEALYTKVADEKIEAILSDLKIEFKKLEQKDRPVTQFEFVANNHRLRLTSFGGTDLMIDAQFKKLPLETVNAYNLKRKFIRAVAYDIRGTEFTSLESNLDCVGGISDSILRYFIRAFGDEVKEFTTFVQDK